MQSFASVVTGTTTSDNKAVDVDMGRGGAKLYLGLIPSTLMARADSGR